jgi:hypothetical protein
LEQSLDFLAITTPGLGKDYHLVICDGFLGTIKARQSMRAATLTSTNSSAGDGLDDEAIDEKNAKEGSRDVTPVVSLEIILKAYISK